MRRYALLLVFLWIFMLIGGAAAQDIVPLDRRLSTPDDRYAVGIPAGWAAEFFTSTAAAAELRLSPDADRLSGGDFTQLNDAPWASIRFFDVNQFRTIPAELDFANKAQILLGIYNVPPEESGVTGSRSLTENGRPVYEVVLQMPSGIAAFARVEGYGETDAAAVALFAPAGALEQWIPTARAVLASIGIRGVIEPPALEMGTDAPPSMALYPPSSTPIEFMYPPDWILVTYPADRALFMADLHNGIDALHNIPDPQTGLTRYDSGEFTLRVLIMEDALANTIVDFLENRRRELNLDVYTIGALETFTIGSRDAARSLVSTAARDGSFTALAVAPGVYMLLSASSALGELDQYADVIAQVAESIRLTR